MMKKFEDLTVQTINIVQYMKQIKSIINIIPNLGKYDLDIISQKFNFDKNYVIKMKFETNFLKKGVANMFFDIKNDYNPFIIKRRMVFKKILGISVKLKNFKYKKKN